MERFGICLDGFTALRAEPKSSSEMISSLVFGEQYKVLEITGEWLSIMNLSDEYQAWLSISNHNPVKEVQSMNACSFLGTIQNESTKGKILIGPGCFVPNSKDTFKLGNITFNWVEQNLDVPVQIEHLAMQFMGTPYLWGGRSVYGIDCSGFSQMVYRAFGLKIPRDSRPQSEQTEHKVKYEELESGDLAFFVNEKNRVNHVGIVMENHQIIHASGSVHIDALKPDGIYNSELKHTHVFAWGIKKPQIK